MALSGLHNTSTSGFVSASAASADTSYAVRFRSFIWTIVMVPCDDFTASINESASQ